MTARAEQRPSPRLSESLRASAACVRGVLDGRSLSEGLAAVDARLRPSAQAISFHAMRRLGTARALRARLLRRAPSRPFLEAHLLVALSLLETALDAPAAAHRSLPVYAAHTIVNEAVNAATGPLAPFRGLVNATLRNYVRRHVELHQAVAEEPEARWNYPLWWIETLQKAWPGQWQALLEAGNQPAPMVLRVNRRRASVAGVLARFGQAGVEAHALTDLAIHVARPRPVTELPGFEEGLWSVQDLSAQKAGALLELHDGMRVLDACAAPGGKTAHLLERASLDLLALDVDAGRLERVAGNLDRLGLRGPGVALKRADASRLSEWWDGRPFDAVLADVPCTGSGVVRRHPDIRWLRRPSDIGQTVRAQRAILDAVWQVLRPGGQLLLVTCSIFPQEGEEQALVFCHTHPDAQRLPAPGQVLPLQEAGKGVSGDGFFYAGFIKKEQGDRVRV